MSLAAWTERDRPDFMATGLGGVVGSEGPQNRVRSFALIRPNDKYRRYIDAADASHATFNLNDPAIPTYHQWVGSCALTFLDAMFYDDQRAAAWLHAQRLPSISGGVASLERK